ncbi:class I SAM-dependent methyltransferase [Weeksellaceae bacterium A-14]|uniref:class I SAM-dependent methyltransferase n=1 Tax=Daejeonia sp. YH14 TaxID=3439042 RepID=UPI0031E4B43B
MKVKDYFLTQENFEILPTDIDGILKTSPIPENISQYYESENYISHHQDSGSLKEKIYKFLQGFNLNYKRNTLAKEAGVHLRILDYGCGAGEFLKFIETEYTTYGYEPNKDAVETARKKTQKTKFVDSLDQIEDGSLDIITLWHVFEHIEDRDNILRIFHRKLSKEGTLIIAVPNHTSYDAKKYHSYWAAYDVPRHIWHYSVTGMKKLMNTENWKLRKVKPLLLDSFYISMLSEKYKKSPLFWIKGFIFGGISNFKGLKSGEFSSMVYIIDKKQKIDF